MPRAAAILVAVAAAFCAAAITSSSKSAAAPKRHHEVQYYTVTLTNAARGPRFKAKAQTNTGKGAVVPQGSVRFLAARSSGWSPRLNNVRLRKR